MKIVPLTVEHVINIKPQQRQQSELAVLPAMREYADSLMAAGPGLAGINDDGDVVFIIGKAIQWKGRHIVWSLMSHNAGKCMISIVRACRRLIESSAGDGRLELIVQADFAEGCRMANELLGFSYHHYEEKFLPDGSDARIYVRYV